MRKEKEWEQRRRRELEETAKFLEQKPLSEGCWGDDCICSIGDEAERKQLEKEAIKLSMETDEAEKENKS